MPVPACDKTGIVRVNGNAHALAAKAQARNPQPKLEALAPVVPATPRGEPHWLGEARKPMRAM